jgi:hypothetical protein
MTVLDQIAFAADADALFAQLRVDPKSGLGIEVLELLDRAAPLARPKAVFIEAFIDGRDDRTVTIEGVTFTSRVLRECLEEVERVFPYVTTCGIELDALLEGLDDEFLRFALDCIKQAALSAAMEELRLHLAENYGLTKSSTMNPGSGDVDVWPIEQQAPLFSLFGDVEALIGVRLTESFLMCPNKSVSGIVFPTEVDFVTCQLCHREDCPNRRAPFDEHLWMERHGTASPHGS